MGACTSTQSLLTEDDIEYIANNTALTREQVEVSMLLLFLQLLLLFCSIMLLSFLDCYSRLCYYYYIYYSFITVSLTVIAKNSTLLLLLLQLLLLFCSIMLLSILTLLL